MSTCCHPNTTSARFPSRSGTDLALAGIGLGLVIGPLTSAALRVVPSAQHGIASSLVVVARMTGMLVGVAALSAWGLRRFNQIMATLPKTDRHQRSGDLTKVAENGRTAYTMQFGEIFFITFIVCVAGARVRVVHRRQDAHADESEDDSSPASPGRTSRASRSAHVSRRTTNRASPPDTNTTGMRRAPLY